MMVKRILLLLSLFGMIVPTLIAQDSLQVKWGTIRITGKQATGVVPEHVEQEALPINANELNLFEMPLQVGGPVFSQLYTPIATPREGQYVLYDFVVTKAGRVDLIRIHESTDEQLKNNVLRMLKQTRWRPAIKGSDILDCRFPTQIVYFKD
ncbi:MAG: energy transducer TonB [Bacteroidota bacterium]